MGCDFFHEEGLVEHLREGAVRIGGQADEEEDECHLENADEHALFDMAEAEVPDFVGENGEDLLVAGFLDESIEECDFLMFPESGEVGVGLGGAFRSIDDEYSLEWESAFFTERFDFGFELSVFHRGEFVEEWKYERRGQVGEEELENGDE